MSNKITEMMGRLARGLKGKPAKYTGPVGNAIEVVQGAIKVAKERGVFVSSPVLRAVAVLEDHTRKVRAALAVGVELVDLLEEETPWSPEKVNRAAKVIAAYKLACVGCRLDQQFPEAT